MLGIGALLALGGGLQAAGAYFGGQSAERAARVEADAITKGIQEQARQFGVTEQEYRRALEEMKGQLSPYREAGTTALGRESALLGLEGPEAQRQAMEGFAQSPGQRFMQEQAERALLRNASAIGGLGGGNVRTELNRQAVGFAQQDYNNYLNRLGTLRQTGLSTVGMEQPYITGLGTMRANLGTNTANLLARRGEARSSGIRGRAAAYAKGIEGLTSLGTFGIKQGAFG